MKKEIIIYLIIAIAAYILYTKLFSRSARDRDYLHTLGFGIADRMTDDEVHISASYIRDYRQKGIEPDHKSFFYSQVMKISDKYKIF